MTNPAPFNVLHWNFGILNDVKFDRLRKSGILINNKKKANPSLKLANTSRGTQDTFVKFNDLVGRNVKRLEAYYDYIMPKQIIYLNIYLQKTCDLESLTLNFRGGREFTDSRLIALGHALKALHCLKVLDIEITEPKRISDKGFYKFAAGLINLNQLRSFSFSVDLCHVTDISVGKLAKSIGYFSELRSLDLILMRFAELKGKALSVLAYNIQKLNKLESFILDLSWCRNIAEESLIELNDALSSMKTLKEYSLTCRKCSISDNTITSFARMLGNLPELHSLRLDMYGCTNINEESLCELFKNLAIMKSIRKISLYLGPGGHLESSFGDVGMEMLGNALKNFEHLKEFKSTFCEFKNLSDEGIQKLGKAVTNLKELEIMEIRFSFCEGISKEGLCSLGQLISTNPSVSQVYLAQ